MVHIALNQHKTLTDYKKLHRIIRTVLWYRKNNIQYIWSTCKLNIILFLSNAKQAQMIKPCFSLWNLLQKMCWTQIYVKMTVLNTFCYKCTNFLLKMTSPIWNEVGLIWEEKKFTTSYLKKKHDKIYTQ